VKPARFEYVAPSTLDEAIDALAAAPDTTTVLAGGQSLMPMLNMRLARPEVLLDLNGVDGLDTITVGNDGTTCIGAMVRQRALETSATLRERLPLLADATGQIAHVAIRTRGTVGGSLAHADPAAELPAVMVALRARVVLQTRGGTRSLEIADFIEGPLMTALEPGELLVAAEIDALPAGTGSAFAEVARTHGAFALAGAAALVHTDSNGQIDFARLALCGSGGAPYVPEWLDDVVLGQAPTEELFADVAARIRETAPKSGENGNDYGRKVAGVVAARGLAAAASRNGGGER
jgi:aerobic carbon-monoxide dehydrogenase medium subunit